MKKPNILIVTGDQWRRDSLGFMRREPVYTPNFDAFARESAVCSRAYSCSPLCTPARAAILTGRHPWGIDMMYNWLRVPVDEPCISSTAAESGYDTALIGKWHLDDHEPDDPHGDMWNCMTPPGPRRMGFRYWYSYGCVHDHWRLSYLDTDGKLFESRGWQLDHETDRAVEYIRNREGLRPPDKPWLMWLSWSPPHNGPPGPEHSEDDPRLKDKYTYFAPREFENLYTDISVPAHPDFEAGKYLRQAPGYYGCISSMDWNFGRIMNCLREEGVEKDTIVLLSADHGEMLGRHGRWMKDIWYEESIGVPFIIRWPEKISPGTRDGFVVNSPDIMPTLLGLAGLQCPAGRDGADLSSTLRGEGGPSPDRAYLSFCTGAPPPHKTRYDFPVEKGRYWRGIRTMRYTYACVDQRPESIYYNPEDKYAFPEHATRVLFDNEKDPQQINPIFPGEACDDIIEELHSDLKRWLESVGDPFLDKYWSPHRQA